MEEQQNMKYGEWLDERMIHYVKPYFCKYIIASLEAVSQGLPFYMIAACVLRFPDFRKNYKIEGTNSMIRGEKIENKSDKYEVHRLVKPVVGKLCSSVRENTDL